MIALTLLFRALFILLLDSSNLASVVDSVYLLIYSIYSFSYSVVHSFEVS